MNIAAGICLAAVSNTVFAQSAGGVEWPTAASFYTRNSSSINSPLVTRQSFNSPSFQPAAYLLAANEANTMQTDAGATNSAPEFKPPWLSGRKAHQYLGLGTVIFAGLTALAAPPSNECENCPPSTQQPPRQTSGTTHTRLARATAAMAVATVLSGLWYHWDDFHLEDGFADPDNQHVMLAGTGSLLMLYAINKSAKSAVPTSHAGIAELGAATMLVAIKLTW